MDISLDTVVSALSAAFAGGALSSMDFPLYRKKAGHGKNDKRLSNRNYKTLLFSKMFS